MADKFSQWLLAWFAIHGRTHLPWQQDVTPYHVWISEIMLQQTQVNTVIPYYVRFMQRFPDMHTLANAPIDAVLHHWTGLGYYARARHLHQAAQQVCATYQGQLPDKLDKLLELSGIGRSTAGAILALGYDQRQPILDGNVKRVLCRYHAIEGWHGTAEVTRQLWELAEQHTPTEQVANYTQAIMDLGATVCTRSTPRCGQCPCNQGCQTYQLGTVANYPTPKPRKTLPVKTTFFIMLQNQQGEVFLEKRPSQGIWGGLWSFPECSTLDAALSWCQHYLSINDIQPEIWTTLRHTFTHFHLDITPLYFSIQDKQSVTLPNTLWYNNTQICGLAKPVTYLLTRLTKLHTKEDLLL